MNVVVGGENQKDKKSPEMRSQGRKVETESGMESESAEEKQHQTFLFMTFIYHNRHKLNVDPLSFFLSLDATTTDWLYSYEVLLL